MNWTEKAQTDAVFLSDRSGERRLEIHSSIHPRDVQETWGRLQRNKYLAELDKSFHRLAEEPELGRSCDEIRKGYRKISEGRHVLFYRSVKKGIEIVRVLHGSMDIANHLSRNS